jgi:hypothetical protein
MVAALILRADCAVAAGEGAHAAELLDRADEVPLTDDERSGLADSLARASDLRLGLAAAAPG